jgi:hypothetical protein
MTESNESPLPMCAGGTRSDVSSEDIVDPFDRHAALTYRRSAPFHRTGAHVAGGKNARPACLQRPWRTAHALP